ncbi:MAG: aminotransferase class V-fold PLP-dependent enzyme [Flavobacteriales bacterium]|jgi:cysteine desulfurase/selenocysteine lyase|tara:strand:- start:19960 stop:21174 length:1215 start_codon:yes stop_codon:yes gene_type:complete
MRNEKEIRDLFPLLDIKVNERPLIYFDNAATTQKSREVIAEIEKFYLHENSNIHRGVHHLSQISTDNFEKTRTTVQNFINAEYNHEIIFTKGTTESINLLASCYREILKKDDEIIISEMEHHSNIVPWQICCQNTGAKLKIIPIDINGNLDLKIFKKLLNSKTKLVAITHISNSLGTINPIENIIKLSHEKNAKVLIDGAQSAAHVKIDVQSLDADFYCFSAHKLFGPTGVGVLYGKEKLLNLLPPYQGGGEMIKDVSFEKTTYAPLPFKFEAGTPNICGVVAFKKAIELIKRIGIDKIQEHEDKLLAYATKKLKKIKGLKIYGEAELKSAIISFNIDGIHHYDLGLILDKMGIAIRTGHHCTQPVMKKFKIAGTARISFAYYNTFDEIDECVKAIEKAKKMLL